MISILIPVYNYDISILVNEIIDQCESCEIRYEVICFDDGSDEKFTKVYDKLKSKRNFSYIISNINVGRIEARQKLASLSAYDWLLFLDADVKIKSPKFISNYLKVLVKNYEAVFGGFAYYDEKPNSKFILRWKYGKAKEAVPAISRNLNPYKVVISANYIIHKKVFNEIYGKIRYEGYGYDNFFGALLKRNRINVLHIDNEVYHLGLEESQKYLSKKEEAAKSLLTLYHLKEMNEHNNTLLNIYEIISRYRLRRIFSLIYVIFSKSMKYNLLSSNPSISILQLYRLSFMCHLAMQKSKKE